MNRPAKYKTGQRDAILSYLASLGGGHVTAGQIAEHFRRQGSAIGVATIYRCLDMLVDGGVVRRYAAEGVPGACFQYADTREDCHEHFHLKCDGCGELLHLQCELLEDISRHIGDEHDFRVDAMKTVVHGQCAKCRLHHNNTADMRRYTDA